MRLVFSLEVDQYNSMQAFFNFNPEVVATDSFSFPSAFLQLKLKCQGRIYVCLTRKKSPSKMTQGFQILIHSSNDATPTLWMQKLHVVTPKLNCDPKISLTANR
jgi:hypothetical protein